MTIDLAEFRAHKKRAGDAQRAADRAAGQLDAAMKKLKEDYNAPTIAAGEKIHKRLISKAAETEDVYDEAVEKFEEEWDGKITDDI